MKNNMLEPLGNNIKNAFNNVTLLPTQLNNLSLRNHKNIYIIIIILIRIFPNITKI